MLLYDGSHPWINPFSNPYPPPSTPPWWSGMVALWLAPSKGCVRAFLTSVPLTLSKLHPFVYLYYTTAKYIHETTIPIRYIYLDTYLELRLPLPGRSPRNRTDTYIKRNLHDLNKIVFLANFSDTRILQISPITHTGTIKTIVKQVTSIYHTAYVLDSEAILIFGDIDPCLINTYKFSRVTG